MRQMNELVKKIMEKNRKAIDEIFRIVMEDKLPTAELVLCQDLVQNKMRGSAS